MTEDFILDDARKTIVVNVRTSTSSTLWSRNQTMPTIAIPLICYQLKSHQTILTTIHFGLTALLEIKSHHLSLYNLVSIKLITTMTTTIFESKQSD